MTNFQLEYLGPITAINIAPANTIANNINTTHKLIFEVLNIVLPTDMNIHINTIIRHISSI
jgi:hypothetical protein